MSDGTLQEGDAAYMEGYRAFRSEGTEAANPHVMGTRERRWWDQGCAEAHLDWAHDRHAPFCTRRKTRMVPDKGHASPYMKDWGGHPPTREERERLPCTCGLAPTASPIPEKGRVGSPTEGES